MRYEMWKCCILILYRHTKSKQTIVLGEKDMYEALCRNYFSRVMAFANLLLLATFSLHAQEIPIGTWRTHFNYSSARLVESTGDKIFCASENGLFSVDLTDHSVRKLSKIDGFGDTGISAIEYDDNQNVLVVGYQSGIVDLVSENAINTLSAIASSNLIGDKTINAIAFTTSRTFLARDLGIVVLNTSTAELIENYVYLGENGTEVEVNEVVVLNKRLFAITNDGVQSGSINANLRDFNSWDHYPGTRNFTSLKSFQDMIYAINGRDLMQWNGSWSDTGTDLPMGANKLYALNNRLVTTTRGTIYELVNHVFKVVIDALVPDNVINDLTFAANEYWVAESVSGLLTGNGEILTPDGPASDTFSSIKTINHSLYAFHAPSSQTYTGSEKNPNYSVFENGRWHLEQIPGFQNVSSVSQFGGVLYFGSIGDGFYDGKSQQIVKDIPGSHADIDTMIVAMKAGDDGLWVSSLGNQNPLHQLSAGNKWTSYGYSLFQEDEFYDMEISTTGILWMINRKRDIRLFNASNNATDVITSTDDLPARVHNIDITVGDAVWIATHRGPAFYSDASSIFDDKNAVLPSFENGRLFAGEVVSQVETDGGSRVWFGTSKGLWLFDKMIANQLAFFNVQNSPLPSNTIYDLEYDTVSGELFVLTDKGLVSYRSASSVGRAVHRNVTIFPNPVRPGYEGLVGFNGLARNVTLKITDVSGNLVKGINANGGTASWDLKDLNNTEVATGIYLVFSASSTGEETYVGKLAVVR